MSPGQPRTPRPSTSRSGGSEDRGHHRLRPRRQPPCPTGSGFRTPTPPRPAPSARLCSAVGSGFGDRRAPSSVAAARWTRAPSGASANAVVATSAASTRFGQALRFAMDVPSLVGHPHGMRTRDFQIDPDQPAGMSRHQQLPSSVRGIHRTRQTATHSMARSQGRHAPTAAPCKRFEPRRVQHFPHPGHLWPAPCGNRGAAIGATGHTEHPDRGQKVQRNSSAGAR